MSYDSKVSRENKVIDIIIINWSQSPNRSEKICSTMCSRHPSGMQWLLVMIMGREDEGTPLSPSLEKCLQSKGMQESVMYIYELES